MGSSLYLTIFVGPVEAVPAPKPLVDALVSLDVTVAATGRSGFHMAFTIADRSPLQTLFLLASGAPIPVLRVILMATVGFIPEVLMDGIVKNVEIIPSATSGNSTLRVTGEDLAGIMDLIDMEGLPFPGMSSDMQVTTILAKYSMFGIVPSVMPTVATDVPVPTERIPIQSGTDLYYINQLARETGYVFYIDPGPVPGMATAYWGPQIKIGVPQPALNVNMDSWTNVENLQFHYRPETAVTPKVFLQEPITKMTMPLLIPSVTPLNPPLAAITPTPQRIEPLDDTANKNPAQALMLGWAKASDTADVVTGEGTLDVMRYGRILKARELVTVRGAGAAYDGLHYVDSTTHTLKRGEYKQSFTLKRNGLVSNLPLVPNLPF